LTPKSSQVLTVSKIRANVNKGDPHRKTEESAAETSSNTVQIQFSVFDGVPDNASPWAKFIDPDEYDDEDEETCDHCICIIEYVLKHLHIPFQQTIDQLDADGGGSSKRNPGVIEISP